MLSLFRWLSTADTRLCRAEWRWQNPGVKEAFFQKSGIARRIVVARNGITPLFRKNRGCIRLPPGGRWILRSKRRREPAKVRAYIKSSNLLIESLPPQAPSTTLWSPSLSEGGFFVPKFCAKQKIIPQGCTLVCGRFVNRPYDMSRILMEQGGIP